MQNFVTTNDNLFKPNNAILPASNGANTVGVFNPQKIKPGISKSIENFKPDSIEPDNSIPQGFKHQRTQAPALNQILFGKNSENVICPYCEESVETNLTYSVGGTVLYFALLIVLVCFPLAWIPFVMKFCKDAIHWCPSCKKRLGRYRRSIYDVYAIKIPRTTTVEVPVVYQNPH